MFKSNASKDWLAEVEALEERLEGMKLTAWQTLPKGRSFSESVVRSTAGLLKGRVPSGTIFQQRIRRQWISSLRRRTD